MTLPNDVARCAGAYDHYRMIYGEVYEPLKLLCVNCLRRTSLAGEYTPHMAPPEFTTACPYRIAPHD